MTGHLRFPSGTINPDDIWILGRTDIKSIKCISWDTTDLPNFDDCTLLIVDMTTFDTDTLSKIQPNIVTELCNQISQRFYNDLVIICILPSEHFKETIFDKMLFWSPIKFSIKYVKPSKFRNYRRFTLNEYMKELKECTMILEPKMRFNAAIYPVGGEVLSRNGETFATDLYLDDNAVAHMIVLPPLKNTDNSIITILKLLGILEQTISPPTWIDHVTFPSVDKIRKSIKEKEKILYDIKNNLQIMENEKTELEKWFRLLYSTGDDLEHIVRDSFVLLGFNNVKLGENQKEDLSIELKTAKYKIAMVEVKGKKASINHDDIRQAVYWTLGENNEGVKSVLVANMFRLDEYPKSKKKRLMFRKFKNACKRSETCIIPTVVLFELVCNKLESKTIDIDLLKKAIASSNGMIENWEQTIKK